jgi:hypothetical protein
MQRVTRAMDSTRLSMRETLEELKERVQESADWRLQVSRRPVTSLGVAVAIGVVLARILIPAIGSARGALGTPARRGWRGLAVISSVSGAVGLLTQLTALPPLVMQVRRVIGRLGSGPRR